MITLRNAHFPCTITQRMFRLILLLTAGVAYAQSPPELAQGQALFETHCTLCHGVNGKGSRGPSLTKAKLAKAPDDAALKKLIENGLEPEMPGSWFLAEPDVAHLIVYVRSLGKIVSEPVVGNALHGASLYTRNKCSGCHIVAGEGSGFGPELTEIATRRSPSHLRESIVSPAATLPEGFLMIEVKTRAGRTVRGIRANEDPFTVQIKDANGHFHSFRKSELSTLNKLRGQSPMPAYKLSPTDLDDLVAYLASLGAKQ